MSDRKIQKKELILTARLELKPYKSSDIEDLAELLTNEEIAKTFMVPDFKDREETYSLASKLVSFSKIDDTAHLDTGIYFEGKLVGFINDCGFDNSEIEIGYVIHPHYKGRGFATEAVSAIFPVLKDMGFKKVTAGFFDDNIASLRVMEKCGMQLVDKKDEIEYRGIIHNCSYCEIDL